MDTEIKQMLKEIEKLGKKYDSSADQKTQSYWVETLDSLGEAYAVKEVPLIKRMIEQAKIEIEAIETRLMTEGSDKLNEKERDRLIDKKEIINWFLTDFLDIETQVKSIKEEIFTAIDQYNKDFSTDVDNEE